MYDRALSSHENRRYLQEKLISVSRYVVLLESQYKSKSPVGDTWISTHFETMGQYILEHEQLVVAPQTDPLNVLRRDFYALMKILISGRYGDFKLDRAPASIPEKTKTNSILRGIFSVIGLLVPAFIFYILHTEPVRFESMGINSNTIFLIALAWLLLTLDGSLKLGTVERITGLAKAMRDLR